jgi:pimeloyl-ACP methyl ester carboxylesterase
MPRCYVLPGILGSELYTSVGERSLLWANYDRLALGEFDRLELAANGIFAKPPRGMECSAGAPLTKFYGTLIERLQDGLSAGGYSVIPWGYDWRKDMRAIGAELATQIFNGVTIADPCSIVAHSQGGLVARVAWAALKQAGQEGLIRRIVTLGTPHRGSYAPALVWCGQEELLSILASAMAGVIGIQTILGADPPDHLWTIDEIAAVTGTWPAMYQLLPLLDAQAGTEDPQRAEVFDVGNWPAKLSLSSQHFSNAKDIWQPLLDHQVSQPPPEVLTTIAGRGIPTPGILADAGELGSPEAFSFFNGGDGRVAFNSALVPGAKQGSVQTSHSGILEDWWVIDHLPEWVREIRTPPVPPAPPIVSPIVSPSYGTGPPFRLTPDFGHDC